MGLVITLITVFMISVSSFAEANWRRVHTIDFSSMVPTLQIPELKCRFDASVENGALELKSVDVCEWVANDLSNPNATANTANGIKVNGISANSLQKVEGGYTYNGKTYEYIQGSDVAWLMDNIAGKNAMRLMCYPKISSTTQTPSSNKPITSNYYKMKIADNDKFLANIPGTYEFEVDYYIPAGSAVTKIKFGNGETTSLTKGQWATWKFTEEVTNLSGDFWLQMLNVHPYYPVSATVYINRVSIKKAKTEVPVYSAQEKTAMLDLGLENTYGDTAVSFDMTLPENTKLSENVYYNDGTKNSGRFGLADENGNQLAAVQIDSNADGTQVLYAVTGGNTELVELYKGDILGKTLNYRFETDFTDETYTVAVTENGRTISDSVQKFGPYTMINASGADRATVRKLRLVHNSTNAAMYTVIDNITSDFVEDVDYIRCMQDAENLDIGIPSDGIVSSGFELPTEGANSGAKITWSSSSGAAVIDSVGDYCRVFKGDERTSATITATLEIGDVKFVKSFEIIIEKNDKIAFLKKINIPAKDSTIFGIENLKSVCTEYDALFLYNICAGISTDEIPESAKHSNMTQGELAELFMELFDIDAGTDTIGKAKQIGLIENVDGFGNNEDAATIYDLANIVHNCIAYDPENDNSTELPVFKTLLETKMLDGLGYTGVLSLKNQKMLDTYIYGEKKYSAETIQGGKAGVGDPLEFGFVSYFGSTLDRPYFTNNHWTTDGKSFVCCVRSTKEDGTPQNLYYVYLYNIETQTFRYITTSNSSSGVTVGEDDYLYFLENNGKPGEYSINRKYLYGESKTEVLFDGFGYMWPNCLHVTNDGRYASIECGLYATSPFAQDKPAGTTIVIRIDLVTKDYDIVYKSFDYSNTVNHMQINPEYGNLIFFAHETNTEEGFYYTDILDRSNILNFDTEEVTPITQGLIKNTDGVMLFFTHESWSADGEHLYITNMGGRAENTPNQGVIRVDKDGTHRRFYYSPLISGTGSWGLSIGHIGASGDNKWAAIDGNWVYLMSLETNQIFPICESRFFAMGHPNHPHPTIARHKYVAEWGMRHNDILGISWYDFSELAEQVDNSGGTYNFGDDVKYVDYSEWRSGAPELLCEVEQTTKEGKTALKVENGKNLYVDINEDVIDTVNGRAKITLDYFDNSTDPIVITYTKGAENDNDLCVYENMTTSVARTGTNTWKTAEVIIESGNFEGQGTHGTDFFISGSADVYISQISVDNFDEKHPVEISFKEFAEEDGVYKISGRLSRTKDTVDGATILAATYDDGDKFLNPGMDVADYGTNSVADFEFEIPSSGTEDSIKFFVLDNQGNLTPYSESIYIGRFNLTAESAANGVRLSWDAVDGADEYEVYRDGKRIAVTTETSFDDRYFTVAEQIQKDYEHKYTTPHSYVIRCGNSITKSVKACIDKNLIRYVTSASDTIIDFGDTSADTYVAVVTAAITDKEEKTLFHVRASAGDVPGAINYADMNDKIVVYSAFMSRPTGKKFLPKKQGTFSVPEYYLDTSGDNGGYSAYVFKIKACFDSSAGNNLIFTTQDGATVKSVAFIKEKDFIY